MKDDKTTIREFNDLVNMTVSELEKWLKSSDSHSAGWPKAASGGESVGHDSGRKIIQILKSNPDKKPDKYTDEQIQHMRKVVSYCKRHLAQEEQANNAKSIEEVKKTKSYASLKNWGHDPLKNRTESKNSDKGDKKKGEDSEEEEEDEPQTGDKRRKSARIAGSNKKQETGRKKSTTASSGKEGSKNGQPKTSTKSGSKGPQIGDTVSWNWGQGQPQGKVLDVKEKETTVTTKRGNKVSRKGSAKDPAVVLDTGKSKAIKLDHELND